MDREKLISEIQNKLNQAYMNRDLENVDELIREVFNDVEKLRQPVDNLEVKKDKMYRFEVSGFCELDIRANSYGEAAEKCEKDMEDLFTSSLFTDFTFVGEVDDSGEVIEDW